VLSQFQNREGFVHGAGAEAEVRWTAGPGALFSAWYSWSLVRDDTGTAWFEGSPIANSPQHSGALRLLYPIVPQVLSVSTEAVYGGPRHTVADSSEPDRLVGESLQWNAGLSGEYARWNLRYGAFVYDLLDERVLLPGGRRSPFPAMRCRRSGARCACSWRPLSDAVSRRQGSRGGLAGHARGGGDRRRRRSWTRRPARRAAAPSWVLRRAPARCCTPCRRAWATRSE